MGDNELWLFDPSISYNSVQQDTHATMTLSRPQPCKPIHFHNFVDRQKCFVATQMRKYSDPITFLWTTIISFF